MCVTRSYFDAKYCDTTADVLASALLDPEPSHLDEVKAILETVSIPNMQEYLGNLTAFNNRYYTSTTGVDATNWIIKTVGDVSTFAGLCAVRTLWSLTRQSERTM